MLQIWAFLNTLVLLPLMLAQLAIGAVLYGIGGPCKSNKLRKHGFYLAMGVDQYMNVVWLGYPDETISSRTGRAIVSGKPKWYIKRILHPFVDWAAQRFGDAPDHCVRSIEYDLRMGNRYEVWKWHQN